MFIDLRELSRIYPPVISNSYGPFMDDLPIFTDEKLRFSSLLCQITGY